MVQRIIAVSRDRMHIGSLIVAAALIIAFAYLIYVLVYPERF